MISVPIGEELERYLGKQLNKMSDTDIRAIASIIRDNIKARMSSIKARQTVKKVGNGLSNDAIEKYIPKRMGCTTPYTEIYIVEGKHYCPAILRYIVKHSELLGSLKKTISS